MSPTFFIIQMLPILIYIVVDTIWSKPIVSISAAIACATFQLWFTWQQKQMVDWFILLDVALIVGMGVISIVLKDETFFKLKPAIINALFMVFMVVLIVSSDSFLEGYMGRMLPKGMALNAQVIAAMKQMLFFMIFFLAAHTGAVIYTALYSSKKLWAFIAGPGMFFFFIPVMAVVLYRRYKTKKALSI